MRKSKDFVYFQSKHTNKTKPTQISINQSITSFFFLYNFLSLGPNIFNQSLFFHPKNIIINQINLQRVKNGEEDQQQL